MRLATVLTPVSEENLQLAAQCGVNDLVIRYPGNQPGAIAQWVQRARVHGLEVGVVEGYLPIERLKLGIDDGSELRAMKDLLRSMSDNSVGLLCYNFMAGTDWARTRLDAPERGGAKVTAFYLKDVEASVMLGARPSDEQHEQIARSQTPQKLWEHLERMLDQLLPIAESCGVTMAMHPDDPPLASLLESRGSCTMSSVLIGCFKGTIRPAMRFVFARGRLRPWDAIYPRRSIGLEVGLDMCISEMCEELPKRSRRPSMTMGRPTWSRRCGPLGR